MSDTGFPVYTRSLADGNLRYYAKFKLPNGSWGGGVPPLERWARFFGVRGRCDYTPRIG